jgi:hypothetical protein
MLRNSRLGLDQGYKDAFSANTVLHLKTGNGIRDLSPNNYDITVNGTIAQNPSGPASGVRSVDFTTVAGFLSTTTTNFSSASGSAFTIEGWIYPISVAADRVYFLVPGTTSGFQVGISNTSSGTKFGIAATGVAWRLLVPNNPIVNTWTHFAITRNTSNLVRIFLGGVQQASGTVSDSFGAGIANIGGNGTGTASAYMSLFRLSNVERYTANFTPSISYTSDANTVLFFPLQEPLNNNVFLDSSPNNFTITRNGNVTQGSFGPIAGVSSGYFDGTGDFLNTASSIGGFGTGDFTVETWLQPTTMGSSNYQAVVDIRNVPTQTGSILFVMKANGAMMMSFNGDATNSSADLVTAAGLIVVNTWNHVALVRSSGVATIYVNGVSAVSKSHTDSKTAKPAFIGRVYDAGHGAFQGYFALHRISNIARYTANFTPSTSYTSDANTVLFLPFNNAGIFDQTLKNNIETVGNAGVSTAATRFGLPAINFNGSSVLFLPTADRFGFGSGDWTLDGWIYHIPTAADSVIIDTRTSTNAGIAIYNSTTTQINRLSYANNAAVVVSSSVPFTANAWSYWMVKRTSGVVTGHVNGVQVFSVSDTRTLAATTSVYVGRNYINTQPLVGNLFDLRITKGVARPNVVPTAPFPIY